MKGTAANPRGRMGKLALETRMGVFKPQQVSKRVIAALINTSPPPLGA